MRTSRYSSQVPRSNAVLVGEEDWNAIQETLYLLSIPGMRESIREGLQHSKDTSYETVYS